MSESTPPTTGRIRRRASRRAGPVDEHEAAASPPPAATKSGAPAAPEFAARKAETAANANPGSAPVDATPAGAPAGEADTSGGPADAVAAKSATDASAEPQAAPDDAAAPEAEVANSDSDADAGKSTRKLSGLEWLAAVVTTVSLIALAGAGGFFIYHQRHADALASQRADYVQTAKQAILNLTNIKDDTAQQDIDRVLSVASGDLKAEYSQEKDAYAQVVRQAKVKASGEVIETAIESQTGDSAQVLVAAKQTLTNAGDQQPQDRYYRFRVTVTRDDGSVTASKVEFVA